ncbi:unnamed protein product [Rhodiola kirilowii]
MFPASSAACPTKGPEDTSSPVMLKRGQMVNNKGTVLSGLGQS